MPRMFNAVDEGPSRINFISAREERGVTDHGVEDEAFVGLGAGASEARAVVEVHFDRFETELRPRALRLDAQGDAFVGLNPDDQNVCAGSGVCGVEEDSWGAFEMDGDFPAVLGHAFANPHIKRDAGPAPVVDLEFHRNKGFCLRLRVDAFLVAVGGGRFPHDIAGDVLSAHDIREDRGCIFFSEGPHHLELFVADAIRTEVGWGFHGDEAQELEEMVLNHVAEGAGCVVIRAPFFYAHRFARGDLDMVDESVIPEWLKNGIGEPQHHDVLGGLFAEVMIDSVDGVLVEDVAHCLVEGVGGCLILPERFLDDDAGPAAVCGAVESVFFQKRKDAGELAGCDAQVEKPISCGAEVLVELGEAFGEAGVGLLVPELALVIVEAARKIGPNGGVCSLTGKLLRSVEEFAAETFVGFFAAREADDAG